MKNVEIDNDIYALMRRFSYLLNEYKSQRSRIDDSINGVFGSQYKMPKALTRPYDQFINELTSGARRFEVAPTTTLDDSIDWKDRAQGLAIVAAILVGAWMMYRAGEEYNIVWLKVVGVLIGGPLAFVPIFMVGALISALLGSVLFSGPAPNEIVSELNSIREEILRRRPSPSVISVAAIPEEHVAIIIRMTESAQPER